MNRPPLRLNPSLDTDRLARDFARDGRVRIPAILTEECAVWWHEHLRQRGDWRQVVNSGDRLFELDRTTRQGMSPEQRQALDDAVYAGARHGFQYRYETIRTPDGAAARIASDDPLAVFARWMSQEATLDMLRKIVGDDAVAMADAQATAYAPGDFLTGHDDGVAGKNRVAAYVLGLTPAWRCEWGGLLLFHGVQGDAAEAWVPQFNTLNIFAVPQPHSVSEVTRAAPYRRYAITGWLRRGPVPV
ncbi:2OG-Fe(II) oxygenase [Sphingomonas sp. Leaf257]|jgi:Rps23 Pro-64 3,4-dihydroxylase Tpa1-like proline 4-hydroxylase|uniref:2OG-Fe(II) oxygenase n=1 Tax=Sphingomonas sp. Leaf257 TaxID=1736309 RepID=UPI0006FD1DFE|nr:2OG-Fe(II) oxygenase family protein [Sphingomonas sp. Leaf257]KQO57412.1 proline hydroxylase [Sphingomonas sp. Leaf257]